MTAFGHVPPHHVVQQPRVRLLGGGAPCQPHANLTVTPDRVTVQMNTITLHPKQTCGGALQSRHSKKSLASFLFYIFKKYACDGKLEIAPQVCVCECKLLSVIYVSVCPSNELATFPECHPALAP